MAIFRGQRERASRSEKHRLVQGPQTIPRIAMGGFGRRSREGAAVSSLIIGQRLPAVTHRAPLPMIRISMSPAAYAAIAATLPDNSGSRTSAPMRSIARLIRRSLDHAD